MVNPSSEKTKQPYMKSTSPIYGGTDLIGSFVYIFAVNKPVFKTDRKPLMEKQYYIFLPAAIPSSKISLKRCESSFGSEQIIEQKSLCREKKLSNCCQNAIAHVAKERRSGKRSRALSKMSIHVHITLILIVQIN